LGSSSPVESSANTGRNTLIPDGFRTFPIHHGQRAGPLLYATVNEQAQGMIMLSARIVAYPAERRELAQALLVWAAAARQEADLVAAHVYEDLEVPAVFSLFTEWKSASALDQHLRSETFGVLMGALKVLAGPHRMTVTRLDEEQYKGAIGAINRLSADPKVDA
jgi:quinol monooxygenase YgiN